MGVVGDVVGDGRRLGLGSGKAPQPEIGAGRIFGDDAAARPRAGVAPDRPAIGVGERAVVLDQPLDGFPGEVEAVEARVAPFELCVTTRTDLGVVVEAAEIRHFAR